MIVNFKDPIAAGSSRYGPWQRREGRSKTMTGNRQPATAYPFYHLKGFRAVKVNPILLSTNSFSGSGLIRFV
jgi:hypothetical protein